MEMVHGSIPRKMRGGTRTGCLQHHAVRVDDVRRGVGGDGGETAGGGGGGAGGGGGHGGRRPSGRCR